jgi:hypothetical protein
MTIAEDLLAVRSDLAVALQNGSWTPPPGDALTDCEFLKVGFRSWGLEAPDKSWHLVLSRLDFGAKDPAALLTVYAPNHVNAFGDLDWLVFSHSVGANGGTNFNTCVSRLTETLGGAKLDWARRIVYLIGRAKQANAGANNGTFSTMSFQRVEQQPPFVFNGRIREGRTMSIFGPGSAGKTTLVDGLIVAACSGHEIVPGWMPSRPYCSLVLDWDEGKEEEQVRLYAIRNAYRVDLAAAYHYKRMARPLYDVADEIGNYVAANAIELVVVSPVGRATRDHGDNINAPVDELYEILRSFGTTNILIDHVTGANIKGGAEREFGAVRKRDNARGSYSLYAQSEGIGERVIVMKNTKPDALLGKVEPQAVKISYDPPAPESGIYEHITFHRDEVVETVEDSVTERAEPVRLRELIYDALDGSNLTVEELSKIVLYSVPSVKRVLYRYSGRMFNRLPSSKWERLPMTLGDSQ